MNQHDEPEVLHLRHRAAAGGPDRRQGLQSHGAARRVTQGAGFVDLLSHAPGVSGARLSALGAL